MAWIQIMVSAATPIVALILGLCFLRRNEGVKAVVATEFDFRKTGASQFFACYESFLVAIERELALLTVAVSLDNPNNAYGTQLQNEASALHPTLSELELRIRRSVVFAPKSGESVKTSASRCLQLMANLINTKQGDFDEIIKAKNAFSQAAKESHAEMLGIKLAEPLPDADGWHVQETYKSMITLGQGILKLTFAVNGAAIIAVMTFLGNLSTRGTPVPCMQMPLVFFVIGLVCSAVATGIAYFVQFFNFNESIGNTAKRKNGKYVHEYCLWGTVAFLALSLVAFACGAFVAVWRL